MIRQRATRTPRAVGSALIALSVLLVTGGLFLLGSGSSGADGVPDPDPNLTYDLEGR